MPIYLQLTNLHGLSVARRYEGWHDVHAFSWGAQNSATITQAGKASFSDFSIMLSPSKSATKIMLAVATGKHLEKAIVVVADNEGKERHRYTFDTVILNSFSQSHSDGEIGAPMMNLTLRFRKVTYKIAYQKSDGSDVFETNSWDLATNSGI